MFVSDIYFIDYLKKLSKKELLNINNDKKLKKDELAKLIDINKYSYLKNIIMSFDLEDYNSFKKLINTKTTEDLNKYSRLVNYLISKHVLFQEDNLCIPKDIYIILKDILKDKEVSNYIKKEDSVYKFVDGIIIAYGVIDLDYFKSLINDSELIEKLNNYYKKEYIINDNYIASNRLTNKKRINKYYKNTSYKEFSNKDYMLLGVNEYHHKIKSYKKLIKVLKTNYIFKKSDIKYIDENIVIPYLYKGLNEEEKSKKELESTVTNLFEFKSDKLKMEIINGVMNIREEFPLWEYRGYTKMEMNR